MMNAPGAAGNASPSTRRPDLAGGGGVAGCGIVHTDLGYYYDGVRTKRAATRAQPRVSGRVVAAGAGAGVLDGQAVIVPAVLPCGECDLCRRGLSTICIRQKMPGNDIQGGFANHRRARARVGAVDEARLAAAGLTLAEVSIVADAPDHALPSREPCRRHAGELAIVVGAGGVGGFTACSGARLRRQRRRDRRRRRCKLAAVAGHGAGPTLNSRTHDAKAIKSAIQAFARRRGLRSTEWFIFECSGHLRRAAHGLRPARTARDAVGRRLHDDKVEVRLST